MGPHDHLWRSSQGTRRRTGSRARCWRGHGKESGGADHPLPQGLGGRRQGWRFFCTRRLGGQDPHARTGGRSRRASATGTAVFRVLGRQCLRGQLAINAASLPLLHRLYDDYRDLRGGCHHSSRFTPSTDSAAVECERQKAACSSRQSKIKSRNPAGYSAPPITCAAEQFCARNRAEQRHGIIQKRLALPGEESVSVGHRRHRHRVN
jgi:hypothetical protein